MLVFGICKNDSASLEYIQNKQSCETVFLSQMEKIDYRTDIFYA